jgi:hypothetical protein
MFALRRTYENQDYHILYKTLTISSYSYNVIISKEKKSNSAQ